MKGKKYISASRAAELTGYASDYIGQLCRAKKIHASLVGRSWYVLESEILNHKDKNLLTHRKTLKIRKSRREVAILKTLKPDLKNKEKETKILKKSKAKSELELGIGIDKNEVIFSEKKGLKPRISSIRDVRGIKPIYYNDKKELFPIIKREFDIDKIRYYASANIDEVIERSKRKSGFEKFAISAASISVIILLTFSIAFNFSEIKKLASLKERIIVKTSLVFESGISNINNKVALGENNFASIFSANGWNDVTNWTKNVALKIIKPWLRKDESVLVNKENNQEIVINQNNKTPSQARTVVVMDSDREYVDFKIAELKNYFLVNPLAPNVNRYYVTRQNDTIVNNFGNSISNVSNDLSDFQTAIGLSFSTGDLTVTGSTTVADLTATEWLAVGTTTRQDILTLDGALYIESSSPADTYSRLYNTSSDLYWNGSLIAGAGVGNWTTDGTSVWRATGNVGIGTTTPSAKLTIDNRDSNTSPLTITTNGSPGNYTPANSGIFIKDAAGTEMLRIFASDPDDANYNAGNLYIGKQAGFSQPTDNVDAGYWNTGIGSRALKYNTTGFSNTANGEKSLMSNTTGGINSAFGVASLMLNTTGDSNVAIGAQSLMLNETGSNNVALGTSAGMYELGSNSFYIDNQDRENTSGDKAGALLYGMFNATPSLQTLTINASTTIAQNLSVLGTGNSYFAGNVGIGTTSPSQKLDVAGNININTNGTNALFSTYKGANSEGDNLFIGGGGQSSVGQVGATWKGSYNTANGYQSLFSNTTGNSNTANGSHSLYSNTTGAYNTANGSFSLYSDTTGNSNIAIGYGSLYSNITGNDNTAIGDSSLYANTTGSDNTAIGRGAGFSGTGVFIQNTLIGSKVGYGGSTPYSYNTVVGYKAGYNLFGNSNVMFGMYAGAYELGSNSFYIDNQDRENTSGDKAGALLYGMFNATPSLQTLTINASTTIAQNLSVLGTGNSYFAGNVGIGTTSPSYKLNVVDTSQYTLGGLFQTNSAQTAFGSFPVFDLMNTNTTDNTGLGLRFNTFDANSAIKPATQIGTTITSHVANAVSADLTFITTLAGTFSEKMRILSSGNVGIGTTSPYAKLSVEHLSTTGTVIGTDALTGFTGNLLDLKVASTSKFTIDYTGAITTGGSLTLSGAAINSLLSTNASGVIVATSTPTFGNFNATSTAATSTIAGGFAIGGTGFVYDFSTGKVGIGTATPIELLQVAGPLYSKIAISTASDTGFSQISVNKPGQTWSFGLNDVNNNFLFYDNTVAPVGATRLTIAAATGNVGIGTTSPTSILHIAAASPTFTVERTGVSTVTFSNSGSVWTWASSAASANHFAFSPAGTEAMRIMNGGNVGIGTTSPFALLSVAGSGFFNGNLTAANITATGTMSVSGLTTLGYASTTAITSTGSAYFATLGGNVGIGTTSPRALLDISKTTDAASNLVVVLQGNERATPTAGDEAYVSFYLDSANDVRESNRMSWVANDVNTGSMESAFTFDVMSGNALKQVFEIGALQSDSRYVKSTISGASGYFNVENESSNSLLYVKQTGNVGIGTTSPWAKLSVVGSTGTLIGADAITGFTGNLLDLKVASTSKFTIDYNGNITTGGSLTFSGLAINSLLSTNASGVIVATSTPTFGNFNATSTTATSTISTGGFAVGTSQFIVQQNSGNVGIGTSSPGAKLDVNGGIRFKTNFGVFGGNGADTGGFYESGGAIGFRSGGVDNRMFIASAGNIGIGTTSPGALLHISGAANTPVIVEDTAAASSAFIQFKNAGTSKGYIGYSTLGSTGLAFVNAAGSTANVLVTDSGNVGIGTTSPQSKLHLSSSAASTPVQLTISAFPAGNGYEIGGIHFRNSYSTLTNQEVASIQALQSIGGGNYSDLIFNTSNSGVPTEKVRITSAGNVGIGTTSPGALLDVAGNIRGGGIFYPDYTTDAGTYIAGTEANKLKLYADSYITFNLGGEKGYVDLSGNLQIDGLLKSDGTGNNYLLGNVGIGTTGPVSKLHVKGITTIENGGADATFAEVLRLSRTSFPDTYYHSIYTNHASGVANNSIDFRVNYGETVQRSVLTLLGSGNVGIGTTSPGAKLAVNGSVMFPALVNESTGYFVCANTTTGNLATSTTQCGGSSLRFKKNVNPLNYGLVEIAQLQPVSYNWQESFMPNNQTSQVGFIAEDVAKIIPEIVSFDAQGRPSNVDYGKLTPILVNAIQEQQKQIAEVKSVQEMYASSTAEFLSNSEIKFEILNAKMADLENDVSATTTIAVDGKETLLGRIVVYLKGVGVEIGDEFTKITKLFVGSLHIEGEVCVDDVCVTKEQFKELIRSAPEVAGVTTQATSTSETTTTTTTISVMGNELNGEATSAVGSSTPEIITASTTSESVIIIPPVVEIISAPAEPVVEIVTPPAEIISASETVSTDVNIGTGTSETPS